MTDVLDIEPEKRSSSPCMAKLDRLSWAVEDWFEIEGYRFGVRTTSAAFGQWVRHVLGSYRSDGPREDDGDALYGLVVEDGVAESGRMGKKLHLLYYGTWDIVRTFDVHTLARSFLHEIESLMYPVRDDAVYVEASLIEGAGRTILIPAVMVGPISKAGRAIRRAADITLPGGMSVALDPQTGELIAPGGVLDIPADWETQLGHLVPRTIRDEGRKLVEQRTAVDAVLVWNTELDPGVMPIARGEVLFYLARQVRNLPRVQGKALSGLAALLERAECLQVQWLTTEQLIWVIKAVVGESSYVPDRSEVTAGAG
jgi:hypothetical protein